MPIEREKQRQPPSGRPPEEPLLGIHQATVVSRVFRVFLIHSFPVVYMIVYHVGPHRMAWHRPLLVEADSCADHVLLTMLAQDGPILCCTNYPYSNASNLLSETTIVIRGNALFHMLDEDHEENRSSIESISMIESI